MADPSADALSRLSWAFRRYFWVLGIGTAVALAVALWGAAAFSPRQPGTTYRARAFVVATTLGLRTDQLPRLATAVFNSKAVAESAVLAGELPYDAEDLIPTHAQIDPVEDNVVIFVDGVAREPAVAAQVANATASALADELNKLGTEIGTFTLQQPADVPTRPVSEPAIPLPLVAGMAGGPLLALGLIFLFTVVRQPVLYPSEAEGIAAVPAVEVCLPHGWRPDSDPARVIGLSTLVKTVFPEHRGMVVVFSCHADREMPALAGLIAQVLERSGPVQRVAGSSSQDLVPINAQTLIVPHGAGPAGSRAPVVIVGTAVASWDVGQFLPPTARALLVVPKGIPRSALRSAVDRFLHDDLAAIAIVESSRRWRRPRFGTPSAGKSEITEPTSERRMLAPPQLDVGDGVKALRGGVRMGKDNSAGGRREPYGPRTPPYLQLQRLGLDLVRVVRRWASK